MAMRDEIKEQKKKSVDMTRKERFQNYMYYHKRHTIIGFFAAIVLIFLIRDIITGNKESMFEIAIINSEVSTIDETFSNDFAAYLKIDSDKQDVTFDNSYAINMEAADQMTVASSQKMVGIIQTGDLDALMGLSDMIDYYTYNAFVSNLEDVLSPELLAQYEAKGQVYYAKTEEGNEIPVGIKVGDSKRLKDAGIYRTAEPIISFAITSQRVDATIAFLNFLYE